MFNKSIPKGTLITPPTITQRSCVRRLNQRFLKIEACLVMLLSLALLSATAFGQGAGASLTGTVADSSDAVLTGATVIATNVDTGVVTRATTNNAGVYNFPSLQVGTYEIVVEASGFSRAVRKDVRLSVGGQARLNVSMAVAGTVTEVEVTGTTESVILEAGSSTGTVMQESAIQSVPLLSSNLMDLVNIMGGVTPSTSTIQNNASFAGVAASNINVVRDGMSVTEVRNPTGIAANTNINQEMIGEFKMILSPVDAEMGRGAGQVQMTTKSGSNAFHGSGVWNVQNTVLDAEDFSSKRSSNPRNWRNLNNYVLTAHGPIIKNKTFFFVTWEQQYSRDKVSTNVKVLTPCAKKGIYRYIDGWIPAARNENDTYNPNTGAMPSVNKDGTPIEKGSFYNVNDTSKIYNLDSHLRIESVFGELTTATRAALLADKGAGGVYGDCSSINFTPVTTGQTAWSPDTTSFYGNFGNAGPFLKPNSYWGNMGPSTTGAAYRYAYDPTGFVTRFTQGVDYSAGRVEMPPVNNYDMGDGLNYAGHRFYNPFVGYGGSIWGLGGDPDRKSITFKIDHNINNEHRLSGTYTYEKYDVSDGYAQWPAQYGGYGGIIERLPTTTAISLTSTLRPTLLNELRFGISTSDTWTYGPMDNPRTGDKMMDALVALFPPSLSKNRFMVVGVGDAPILFHTDPQNGSNPSHPLGSRGNINTTWGGADPRWTIADTMTWMRGAHSFKGGVEYRWQSSGQEFQGNRGFAAAGAFTDQPTAFGGTTSDLRDRRAGIIWNAMNVTGSEAWQGFWGAAAYQDSGNGSGNFTVPYSMMTYFSGSLAEARQYFYAVRDGSSVRWSDAGKGEDFFEYTVANQEFSWFFKDDWKVSRDLMLNLGVRYEYYGVPYTQGGRTIRLQGNSSEKVFGISSGGWDKWMANRDYVDAPSASLVSGFVELNGARPDPVTVYQYVGPDSPNPGVMAWNRDLNNLAPHLGFSWQLPWFGRGLTTVRGGWSLSYSPIDNFNQYGIYVGDVAAANTSRMETFRGVGSPNNRDDSRFYLDLTDLNNDKIMRNGLNLSAPDQVFPLQANQMGQLTSGATVIDENIRNPYVHSMSLSVTRNIGRALTVDLRYIGTMGRQQLVTTNLNQPNYISTGLYSEMEKIRSSNTYQSELLNSLIPAGSLFFGAAPTATGSDMLRSSSSYNPARANMAYGNFASVVSTLATTNGAYATASTTTSGLVSRMGCLPQDHSGAFNPITGEWSHPCAKGTPWNYYYTNPQFSSATLYYSAGKTNYHSMQAQVTMRPTNGLNFQATYTWSRNLTDSAWTNYLGDRFEDRDYTLSSQHRSHSLTTYGGYELPFGPRGFLLRDSSGFVKKAVEGWNLSWIATFYSGAPASVTGTNTLWSNNYPILVRPDLWDDKAGKASFDWIDGNYYGNKYTKVMDANICDKTRMASALYTATCESLDTNPNNATFNKMVVNASAPRALAMASNQTDAQGNVLPQTYTSDYTAADGVTYKAGEPIVVFRNADQRNPTQIGNYGSNRITGMGRMTFDMAASKSIEFMEGKRIELRVDANNVLNHPSPTNGTSYANGGRSMGINNPSFAINSTATFGRFSTKASHRTFQARLALRF